MMGHSSRQQCLSSSWWPIEQHTLGLGDTKSFKNLWMLNWQLNNFFDLLDLLGEATDHIISRIWDLLNFHQRNQWISFGWQDFMQQI